jgi:basic membrane protein A
VQRAEQEFDIRARFLQCREQADYVPNLTLAARNADAVVTLGYLFVDAVKQVAPDFPGTRFIHIEGDIPGDNVACFDFRSEQGGFLAGLVGGLFTRSGKTGMVGGMDIPPVVAYSAGFRAGIRTAERERGEDLEAIYVSAGSFNDPVKGKSLAQNLISRNVDVIFRIAGNTGVGVMEAVKNIEGVYLIAEDLNTDAELPGKILTSTLKRMDVAVYRALRSVVKGGFEPGHRWLGAEEGAMGITDMKYSRHLFSPRQLECIDKAREALEAGKIEVPKTLEELETFEPPEL